MTDDEANALIEQLANYPSPSSWRWLCSAIADVPGDARPGVLERAAEKLEGWPDELRLLDPRGPHLDAVLSLGRGLTGVGTIESLPEPADLCIVRRETNSSADADALAGWSGVGRIRSLDLDGWRAYHHEGAAARLLDALDPSRVESLRFVNAGVVAGEVVAKLKAGNWPALRSLGLGGIGEDGLRALTDTPWLGQLRSIELDVTGLSDEAVVAWLEQLDPGVEVVRLTGKAGPAVATALGRFGVLRELWCSLLEGALGAFCDAASTKSLETLSVGYRSRTSKAGCAKLAGWAGAASLRTLRFQGAKNIDDAALEALAASEHLGGLKSLVFIGGKVGDAGVSAWAKRDAPGLEKLEMIGLLNLGDAGVEALAASRVCDELRVLDLTDNKVSDAGAKALAASSHLGALRELHLSDGYVGLAGFEAVVGSDLAKQLEVLYLDGPAKQTKRVGGKGMKALAKAPLDKLRELGIAGQNISADQILSGLEGSRHLRGLVFLDISHNPQVLNGAERVKKTLREAGFARLQEVVADAEVY